MHSHPRRHACSPHACSSLLARAAGHADAQIHEKCLCCLGRHERHPRHGRQQKLHLPDHDHDPIGRLGLGALSVPAGGLPKPSVQGRRPGAHAAAAPQTHARSARAAAAKLPARHLIVAAAAEVPDLPVVVLCAGALRQRGEHAPRLLSPRQAPQSSCARTGREEAADRRVCVSIAATTATPVGPGPPHTHHRAHLRRSTAARQLAIKLTCRRPKKTAIGQVQCNSNSFQFLLTFSGRGLQTGSSI